jgi:hypothetical protein
MHDLYPEDGDSNFSRIAGRACLSTKLHGITSQKTPIFIVTTARTSDRKWMEPAQDCAQWLSLVSVGSTIVGLVMAFLESQVLLKMS